MLLAPWFHVACPCGNSGEGAPPRGPTTLLQVCSVCTGETALSTVYLLYLAPTPTLKWSPIYINRIPKGHLLVTSPPWGAVQVHRLNRGDALGP
eukprot:7205581-Pyramimonas_sp.AAC.1